MMETIDAIACRVMVRKMVLVLERGMSKADMAILSCLIDECFPLAEQSPPPPTARVSLADAIRNYRVVWQNDGKKPGWCDRVEAADAAIDEALAVADLCEQRGKVKCSVSNANSIHGSILRGKLTKERYVKILQDAGVEVVDV